MIPMTTWTLAHGFKKMSNAYHIQMPGKTRLCPTIRSNTNGTDGLPTHVKHVENSITDVDTDIQTAFESDRKTTIFETRGTGKQQRKKKQRSDMENQQRTRLNITTHVSDS